MSVFPINRSLAIKARKLQKTGLKGKAISEKLGNRITTDEANLLASIGADFEQEDRAALTEREIDVLLGLAALQREDRLIGRTSSPKAKHLARKLRLSEGQIRRATTRLNERGYGDPPLAQRYGFLSHSRNGHIWLRDSGWAVVQAIEVARERIAA